MYWRVKYSVIVRNLIVLICDMGDRRCIVAILSRGWINIEILNEYQSSRECIWDEGEKIKFIWFWFWICFLYFIYKWNRIIIYYLYSLLTDNWWFLEFTSYFLCKFMIISLVHSLFYSFEYLHPLKRSPSSSIKQNLFTPF